MNTKLFDLTMFNDEIDFDAMQKEFEASYQEEGDTSDEEKETVEDTTVEEETDVEEKPEETTEVETDSEPETKVLQTEEQNRAFAEMRRKLQEEAKYAALVRNIAEQNGISPDEVLNRFEQKQLEQQAEQQKVPVEVLQRMQKLEQENEMTKQESFKAQFNAQVNETVKNHNLTQADVEKVFAESQKQGIDLRSVPFETAYKLINLDNLVKKEVESSRQKELEAKKKRQTTSALPNDSGGSSNEMDDIDEQVRAYLKEEGVIPS
jgi:hypothetical protein